MEHRRMRKAVKVEALSEFDQGTSANESRSAPTRIP